MRNGTPQMRILAIPARMRIGTRRTHTVIPICEISHMGTKTPTPHMRTNSLCIRLVTKILPVRIRGPIKSPYAYGDCWILYHCMRMGIFLIPVRIL